MWATHLQPSTKEHNYTQYMALIKMTSNHSENSPVTQTTPEPTLLTWGGWSWDKKSPPPLAMLPNPVLSHLSGHSDPIVLEPFDVTLWYSSVPRTPNLLKISLDIESDFRNGFFSTLHTDFKVESNFYDHYWQSCMKMHLMQPTGPAMCDGTLRWGKIAKWGVKAWSR